MSSVMAIVAIMVMMETGSISNWINKQVKHRMPVGKPRKSSSSTQQVGMLLKLSILICTMNCEVK